MIPSDVFKIYPELKERAVELLDQGHTLAEISKEVGVSVVTIGNWRNVISQRRSRRNRESSLVERDRIQHIFDELTRRGPSRQKKGRKPYSYKFVHRALSLVQKGWRIQRISDELGISYGTIYSWRNEWMRDNEDYLPSPMEMELRKREEQAEAALKRMESEEPPLRKKEDLDIPDNYVSDENRIKLVMTESISPLSRYKK